MMDWTADIAIGASAGVLAFLVGMIVYPELRPWR